MRAVVVGGGCAGLAAALDLADRGAAVTLVERRPLLGGRTYSYRDGRTGDVVDNGQHVLFGAYRATLLFLERIGASRHLLVQPRLEIHWVGGERESVLRAGRLPAPLDLAWGLLAWRGLPLRERLGIAAAVRRMGAHGGAELDALDRMSVAEWLTSLGQGARARERFWDPLAVAAINETPERASARWLHGVVMGVFHGGPGASAVVLPRVGLSELIAEPARAALAAAGARLLAGSAVERVQVGPAGRAGGVALAGGTVLEAEAVVLAVPHDEVASLLPAALAGAPPFAGLDRLGSAPIVSVHLWLDREPTPHRFCGLIGSSMQWLFNISRIRGGRPGHVSLVASAAHALAGKGRDEIEALAVEETRRLFPAARTALVERAAAVVQRQATASLRPGLAGLRAGAATPVPNLALAGDWTDPVLPATIEAAVASGLRAARHVLP